MASNKAVTRKDTPVEIDMRSLARSRYEQGLAQIARGCRTAGGVLVAEGDPEAADEFLKLEIWVRGELDRSLANRRPLTGRLGPAIPGQQTLC